MLTETAVEFMLAELARYGKAARHGVTLSHQGEGNPMVGEFHKGCVHTYDHVIEVLIKYQNLSKVELRQSGQKIESMNPTKLSPCVSLYRRHEACVERSPETTSPTSGSCESVNSNTTVDPSSTVKV